MVQERTVLKVVPICPANSAVGKSRIRDFVIIFRTMNKIGTDN